jgi:hypothetical protein
VHSRYLPPTGSREIVSYQSLSREGANDQLNAPDGSQIPSASAASVMILAGWRCASRPSEAGYEAWALRELALLLTLPPLRTGVEHFNMDGWTALIIFSNPAFATSCFLPEIAPVFYRGNRFREMT